MDSVRRENEQRRLQLLADDKLHETLVVRDIKNATESWDFYSAPRVTIEPGERYWVMESYDDAHNHAVDVAMEAVDYLGVDAEYLGITKDELRQRLDAGTSIAALLAGRFKTKEGLSAAHSAAWRANRSEAEAQARLTDYGGERHWVQFEGGKKYVVDLVSLFRAAIDRNALREKACAELRKRIEADIWEGWDVLEKSTTAARLYQRRRWDRRYTNSAIVEGISTFGIGLPWVVRHYLRQPKVRFRRYEVSEAGELLKWHEPQEEGDRPPTGAAMSSPVSKP